MLPLATSLKLNSIPFKEVSRLWLFTFILQRNPLEMDDRSISVIEYAHSAPEYFGKSFVRHASDVCCRTCSSHHSSSLRRHMGRWSRLLWYRILQEWTWRTISGRSFEPLRRCPTVNNGYENGIHYDCESPFGLILNGHLFRIKLFFYLKCSIRLLQYCHGYVNLMSPFIYLEYQSNRRKSSQKLSEMHKKFLLN